MKGQTLLVKGGVFLYKLNHVLIFTDKLSCQSWHVPNCYELSHPSCWHVVVMNCKTLLVKADVIMNYSTIGAGMLLL